MSVLDSPLRKSLADQSAQLRANLKIFERDFFAANACKPGKEDIKQNQDIAQKYKDYNKIRDVLNGKISAAALTAHSPTQDRKRKRSKRDERQRDEAGPPSRKGPPTGTPRKQFRALHPQHFDPYDAPPSASPRPRITELGPTPQRDGRVLGIFDLLEAVGSAKGSNSKRQKYVGLFDEEQLMQSPSTKRQSPAVALSPSKTRTPAKSRSKPNGDLLDHLTGTPMTGHNRVGARTPASSAKKFMLNQFFATPSAIRYATMLHATDGDGSPAAMNLPEADAANAKTPLVDHVLGRTPTKPITEDLAGDQTPAYLKRTFSFKQRLLSVSTGSAQNHSFEEPQDVVKPVKIQRIAPSQRRKGKFNPRTLSQMAQELQEHESEERRTNANVADRRRDWEQPEEDGAVRNDADDDEWEALREIEVNDNVPHDERDDEGVLLSDSQAQEHDVEAQSKRKWKKKGQKRSTRRVIMRPSRVGVQDPKYQKEAEDINDETSEAGSTDDGEAHVEETQLTRRAHHTGVDAHAFSDDELLADVFFSNGSDEEFGRISPVRMKTKKKASRKDDKATFAAKNKAGAGKHLADEYEAMPARKINPNAQTHMNFRTLKIKNKNSKAKRGAGGKGRFGGKGRR